MYKELIICTIVIVIVVVLNIYTENYTKDSIVKISGDLENLKQLIDEENQKNKNVEDEIDKILEEWDNRYKKLAYYIEHDELEKVNTELVSLKANIDSKEYKQGLPDLNRCIFILEHIKEKSALQIKNIF